MIGAAHCLGIWLRRQRGTLLGNVLFLLLILDPTCIFVFSGLAEPSLKKSVETSAANGGEGAKVP